MTTTTQTEAAFIAADEAWSAEVARVLPGVFNARYQPTIDQARAALAKARQP